MIENLKYPGEDLFFDIPLQDVNGNPVNYSDVTISEIKAIDAKGINHTLPASNIKQGTTTSRIAFTFPESITENFSTGTLKIMITIVAPNVNISTNGFKDKIVIEPYKISKP